MLSFLTPADVRSNFMDWKVTEPLDDPNGRTTSTLQSPKALADLP
jgi:hypothetical protein